MATTFETRQCEIRIPELCGLLFYCDRPPIQGGNHRVFIIEATEYTPGTEESEADEQPHFAMLHPHYARLFKTGKLKRERLSDDRPEAWLPEFEISFYSRGGVTFALIPGVSRVPLATEVYTDNLGEYGALISAGVSKFPLGQLLKDMTAHGWETILGPKGVFREKK